MGASNPYKTDYVSQDRGSEEKYRKYLAGMDTVSVEKVAAASAYFSTRPGGVIVDVGMASGTSTHILGCLFPFSKIIGLDINPRMVDLARKEYRLPNLEFRVDDGEKLDSLGRINITGFFNCSSIHHITSFNQYDPNKAIMTIRRQSRLLAEGGIIVIRDFVKPEDKQVILELPDKRDQEMPDADLLLDFSKTARSLADDHERGFPVTELEPYNGLRRFRMMYADALEFIRRKDYRNDWDVELQEEYAYFRQAEFEELFSNLGLRIIASYPVYNPWILKNRYEGKFMLRDMNQKDLGLPPTNYIIAGEKVRNSGVKLATVRHLPLLENTFLKVRTYRDSSNGDLFDVAQRPFPVIDIIPYSIVNSRLSVIAKHGYPRPIVNVKTDSSVIDDKKYSGYIIEGLTASKKHIHRKNMIEEALLERAGIRPSAIEQIQDSLSYYTSPGGVDEMVESVFIKLKSLETQGTADLSDYSGFADSGMIREYDAAQLIKSAQVGALPEARLEMNIYHLMAKLKLDAGRWLGEGIEILKRDISDITGIKRLFRSQGERRYRLSGKSADFLDHHREKFFEFGRSDSANILEYVIPKNYSINTVITLPVFQHENDYYVGIEKRYLPVPQLQEGDSMLAAAPAYRLPKDVRIYSQLKDYLCDIDFFNSKILSISKLGEKYFPCPGLTPEQVYPYIVCPDKASNDLNWVSLKDLFKNVENLRDGHLLITVFRLIHALNKWNEFIL